MHWNNMPGEFKPLSIFSTVSFHTHTPATRLRSISTQSQEKVCVCAGVQTGVLGLKANSMKNSSTYFKEK